MNFYTLCTSGYNLTTLHSMDLFGLGPLIISWNYVNMGLTFKKNCVSKPCMFRNKKIKAKLVLTIFYKKNFLGADTLQKLCGFPYHQYC